MSLVGVLAPFVPDVVFKVVEDGDAEPEGVVAAGVVVDVEGVVLDVDEDVDEGEVVDVVTPDVAGVVDDDVVELDVLFGADAGVLGLF